MVNEANDGLIDIIQPVAPVMVETGGWLWIAGFGIGLVLMAAVILVLWKYKLPAYRALRQVRSLQNKLETGTLAAQECVLLLALELRHGLGVKQLLANKMPEQFKQQDSFRWQEYIQQLDVMLYQHDPELNAAKLNSLFVQTESWLRTYSRRSSYRKVF